MTFFFFLVLVLFFLFYYYFFNIVLTWKIVEASKVSVLYIYIDKYIYTVIYILLLSIITLNQKNKQINKEHYCIRKARALACVCVKCFEFPDIFNGDIQNLNLLSYLPW